MYEIFQKIDDHSHLSQIMYEGSCCQKFIQLSPIVVEETYYEILEGMVCLYGSKVGNTEKDTYQPSLIVFYQRRKKL